MADMIPIIAARLDALAEEMSAKDDWWKTFHAWRPSMESAIDALTEHQVKLREDLNKTNEACLKENMAWSLTDKMVTQMNDLLGMQQTQIRDLVRQVGTMDKALSRHLEEMGYSE